jgi:hypothetical protein
MEVPDGWIQDVRRDLGRLADGRLPARRRRDGSQRGTSAVYLRWHYEQAPALGAFASDTEAFDLAMRRAAFAVHERRPIKSLIDGHVRLSRSDGLHLRGASEGSLDVLLDIPAWIVIALASAPATAVVNLLTLLSAREMVRVQLRRLILTEHEQRILTDHQRTPLQLPPAHSGPFDDDLRLQPPDQTMATDSMPDATLTTRQGALPSSVAEMMESTEPIVDVEIGHIRVRTPRPDIDVVIQEGDLATSISIRTPKR